MIAEFSETDELPAEVGDPIRGSVLPLIEVVMSLTAPDSRERKLAMNEVLAAVERVKRALRPLPQLH
jgi:hypothetical protein